MKNRLVAAVLAVAGVCMLSCTAPSAHTAPAPPVQVVIDASVLPQGKAPGTEYLIGRTIHRLNAAPISLPRSWWDVGGDNVGLRLVGHVGGAWYVQRGPERSSAEELYRVTRSGVRRIDTGSDAGGSLWWYLSSDDRHVIKVERGTDKVARVTVRSLTGALIARHRADVGGALVGAGGQDVWFNGAAPGVRARRWDIASGSTTALPVGAYLADPAHDLLFTLPRGDVPAGLTSLSRPSTALRWSADFTAVAISPDGTRVVGFHGSPDDSQEWVAEIRNVADGSLVATMRVSVNDSALGDIWWEDDQHILRGVTYFSTKHVTALVRCSTDGVCDRAAGPAPSYHPFTHRSVTYVDQRLENVTTRVAVGGRTVVPAGLPVGSSARSSYLVGRDIHTTNGGTIHLPGTWSVSSSGFPLLSLVGHGGGAYYVKRWISPFGSAGLYRVTRTSTRKIDARRGGMGLLDWFLSSDNRRIVRAETDGYGGGQLVVLDMNGSEIGRHVAGCDCNYNGATGADVWYATSFAGSSTTDWSVTDDTETVLGVSGYLAVPGRDLLFTRPGTGIGPGVTSLSQPGTPTWTAQFQAVAVSPDGTRVLGYKGFAQPPGTVVQVRNLSDGSLVQSLAFPSGGALGDLWWESNSNVLIGYTGTRAWLVRCSTAGVCRRVARYASGGVRYTHRALPLWHAEASN